MIPLRHVALAILLALAPPALSIQPDEVLADAGLEARARDITRELRCVVCQTESIDESGAAIARDLRLLVRERIVAGDTDAEVTRFVVARYGEFVLLRPPFSPANMPLWLAGPVFLIFGIALARAYQRRRARDPAAPARNLSTEEQARLDALMKH